MTFPVFGMKIREQPEQDVRRSLRKAQVCGPVVESSKDGLDLGVLVTLQTNNISCIWDGDKGVGCEEEEVGGGWG